MGFTALSLEKVGLLEFSFESNLELQLEMHIFSTKDFLGTPQESDEMEPQWFCFDDVPYHKMWTSDAAWFPLFLMGQKFTGSFHFDEPASSTHTAVVLKELLTPVEEF